MNAHILQPALLLCSLLLAACASSNNVVQLLPDQGGHVGVVHVTTKGGAIDLTQAGDAVCVNDAKAKPDPAFRLPSAEGEELFGAAERALPARPIKFLLYFENDGVRLTPESRALLPRVLDAVRRRASRDIAVVGHTGKQGDERANITMARGRAEAVATMLEKAGVNAADIEVSSHGSATPILGSLLWEDPRNWRVEVTVR